MAFLSDAKDRLLERVALPILNRTLVAPYGQVLRLRLDSTEKRAEILVDLDGERDPVEVVVGRYELRRLGSETFLTIQAISTSRAWMTSLAERNLVGRSLKLPQELSGTISRLL
jgi:hypothetical protein